MVKIDEQWHRQHPMPKNPTLEQRRKWHIEHAKNCNCRELTDKQRAELGIE